MSNAQDYEIITSPGLIGSFKT